MIYDNLEQQNNGKISKGIFGIEYNDTNKYQTSIPGAKAKLQHGRYEIYGIKWCHCRNSLKTYEYVRILRTCVQKEGEIMTYYKGNSNRNLLQSKPKKDSLETGKVCTGSQLPSGHGETVNSVISGKIQGSAHKCPIGIRKN